MKILFDTHTFLWFIQGDGRLGEDAIRAIEDMENELFFSAASYWELCIKVSIRKLRLLHRRRGNGGVRNNNNLTAYPFPAAGGIVNA